MVAFLVCFALFMVAVLGGYSFYAEAAANKETKQSAKKSKEKEYWCIFFLNRNDKDSRKENQKDDRRNDVPYSDQKEIPIQL